MTRAVLVLGVVAVALTWAYIIWKRTEPPHGGTWYSTQWFDFRMEVGRFGSGVLNYEGVQREFTYQVNGNDFVISYWSSRGVDATRRFQVSGNTLVGPSGQIEFVRFESTAKEMTREAISKGRFPTEWD